MNKISNYNPAIHHRRSIRLKGYDYSQAGSYFITICCEKRKCRLGKIVNSEMLLNQYGAIAHHEWQKLEKRFPNCRTDVFVIMPNHMHGIITLKTTVGSGFTPDHNNDLHFGNDKKEYLKAEDKGAGVNPARTDLDIANSELQNLNDRHNRAGVNPAPIDDLHFENELQYLNDGDNRAGVNPARTDLDVANEDWQNLNDTHNRAGMKPAATASVSDIVGAYKSITSNFCLDIYKSKNERMGKLWQRDYYEHIIRDQRAYRNIYAYIINNPAKWQKDRFGR